MKIRPANLPPKASCKNCNGTGELIDHSRINSASINIPYTTCLVCGGTGIDPDFDPDKPVNEDKEEK